MDRRKKVFIKFKDFCSKKVTIKNINYKRKKFCTFWTEYLSHDFVRSLSEGLQKVKVRKFNPSFETNRRGIDLNFPFTKDLFSIRVSHQSCQAYYSGKINVIYHIENHKNFKIDLYLKNIWAGNAVYPLIHYSFLDFEFYTHLLLEKISYYSDKKITFFVEISFDLEGEYCSERKNREMDKESYFISVYK